jgi:hypothetical protein
MMPGACGLLVGIASQSERMSIKLRTRILTTREDWSVARIALLGDFLREQKEGFGTALFAVAAGDREPLESADPFLSILHCDEFDAMWLAAIDMGADLRPEQCEATSQPRRSDRGLLLTSKDISRRFNVAMAFEASPTKGRLIAECSFHHFADHHRDLRRRVCRSSLALDEPAGGAVLREPAALTSVQIYIRNVATWLALLESDELESLAVKRSVTGLWGSSSRLWRWR